MAKKATSRGGWRSPLTGGAAALAACCSEGGFGASTVLPPQPEPEAA